MLLCAEFGGALGWLLQVVCSRSVWQWAQEFASHLLLAHGIAGTQLGTFNLKGVPHPMELVSCRWVSGPVTGLGTDGGNGHGGVWTFVDVFGASEFGVRG